MSRATDDDVHGDKGTTLDTVQIYHAIAFFLTPQFDRPHHTKSIGIQSTLNFQPIVEENTYN